MIFYENLGMFAHFRNNIKFTASSENNYLKHNFNFILFKTILCDTRFFYKVFRPG